MKQDTLHVLFPRAPRVHEIPGQRARADADAFVRGELRNGPMDSAVLLERGKLAGLDRNALHRARQRLGVIAVKDGIGGGWRAVLPGSDEITFEFTPEFLAHLEEREGIVEITSDQAGIIIRQRADATPIIGVSDFARRFDSAIASFVRRQSDDAS